MTARATTPASETLLSPRLRQLLEQIEQDEGAAVDAFWDEMAEAGTPLVEPDPDDASRSLVTFLWRETEPAAAVLVRELVSWRTDEQRQLFRLPGTDVWYLSWRYASDVRTTYGFAVRPPDGDGHDQPWIAIRDEPDPLNHFRQPDDWQDVAYPSELVHDSILVLPDAEPLPWLGQRDAVACGTVSEHQYVSEILGNERRVWVYEPPVRPDGGEPLGFVLFFDGSRYHSLAQVLDNLIAADEIPPLAAIFVDQLQIRNIELTCNPDFSKAMIRELIPWARAEFNLSHDPKQAIIGGRSFGGLCAAYTALHHPQVFGNVLMQSGSCWHHPSLTLGQRPPAGYDPEALVGVPIATPTIIEEYANAAPAPIRIYQEVGSFEFGPPPTRWWQIFASRHFRDVVQAKGYDLTYREFAGGHDDAWWRGRAADGLLALTSHLR